MDSEMKPFVIMLIFYSFLQGLILSNALRAQKNAEDESCTMALTNLRSEVIRLRNEAMEKDKILLSLVDKVKEDEARFKTQSEAQKTEVEDLRKQLAKAKEKYAVAEAKRGINEYWANHLEKNIEELRTSKERCFEKSLDSVKKLKLALPTWAPILPKRTSYEATLKVLLNG
jgi:predicted RNase H-like nuclease (RuvC/YqgF family)